MDITILKWSKYNPRKDIKHPSWFALSNRFLEDPDLFVFDATELKGMLYLFCQASQKNSAEISINFIHAERVCQIKSKDLTSAIEKLSDIGAVRIRSDHERARTQTSRDNTIQDNTNKQTRRTEFDFDGLYGLFPRKEGKAVGMARLKKRITSKEDFDKFAASVRRYASLVKSEGRKREHILMWSSFVGSDGAERWLDHVPSTSPPPPPTSQASGAFSFESAASEPELSDQEIEEMKRKRAEIIAQAKRMGA